MRLSHCPRILLTLSILLGCASGQRAGGTAPSGRDVINADELAANAGISAYDLIQRIRPTFLVARASQTRIANNSGAAPIAVIVRAQAIGSIGELRQIPVSSLVLIRHYSIEEAKQKFGMQYDGGAIEVTYRDLTRPTEVP